MSRPRPNGCYGAATGRTRTRPPSPTMPGCSIFSASGRRARQRDAVSWSRIRKFFTALRRLPSFHHLLVELHLGVAEEDEIRRRDRDRTVDAEYRDLEFVAGVDGFGEHDAVGHVEALDGGGARIAAAARHLAVDPHFRIVVHISREHRLGARGVEVTDPGLDGQGRAIPNE